VLTLLVASVTPQRVTPGVYSVEILWTAVGVRLSAPSLELDAGA